MANMVADLSSVLALLIGFAFVALFASVLVKIANNKIDISTLLSEDGNSGKASLSRFQFFVFTLVIGGLYLILSVENGQLIDIPNSALTLLGISGGSYLIAKGIKK